MALVQLEVEIWRLTNTLPDDANTVATKNYSPVQFCLQPDNTFVVQNVLGTEDPADDSNIVQICADGALSLYNTTRSAATTCNTVHLQIADVPAAYQVPAGCPTGTVPIPPDRNFCVNFAQTVGERLWLLAPIDPQGTLITTNAIDQATRFSSSADGTGRIQTYSDGLFYYSNFAPVFNENSGYIRMYPSAFATLAVTFCLQSNNSFAVYSAGEDGQGLDDPTSVLTCATRNQPVYLDNGSFAVSGGDPSCAVTTLYYEELPL